MLYVYIISLYVYIGVMIVLEGYRDGGVVEGVEVTLR